MTKLSFSSAIQQEAHEALVMMLQVLHNITIFIQFDDLNLSQPLSQLLSQLTPSPIKTTLMVLSKLHTSVHSE